MLLGALSVLFLILTQTLREKVYLLHLTKEEMRLREEAISLKQKLEDWGTHRNLCDTGTQAPRFTLLLHSVDSWLWVRVLQAQCHLWKAVP